MKHWITKQEMGSGFRYSKRTHEEFYYNSLEKISKHEYNTMRTTYLIRDWWNLDQLKKIRDLLETLDEIEDGVIGARARLSAIKVLQSSILKEISK